jgi:uncharacterized membrane protein
MPGYPLFLTLHVCAGVLALGTFWLNAALRKGSDGHRLVGRVYLIAMATVVATGMPLLVQRLIDGHPVTAAFLGYLLLITSTATWRLWRAVRDRAAPQRYVGRTYMALATANLLAGAGVLALGLRVGVPLLIGFSAVGLVTGVVMLRKRATLATRPLWWRQEHIDAMLGCGIATHIAFLAIGLPRLLPSINGEALQYVAWFGPLAVSLLAKALLDRRFRRMSPRSARRPVTVAT